MIIQHPETGFWTYTVFDEDGILVASHHIVVSDGYFYTANPIGQAIFPITDIDFKVNARLIQADEEFIHHELEISSKIKSSLNVFLFIELMLFKERTT